MKKENLVLLHSFPTNSILLSGYIEYLSDYFIDLPGFTKVVPPTLRNTLIMTFLFLVKQEKYGLLCATLPLRLL